VPTKHPPEYVLVEYSRGELDPAERRRVERHAEQCPACKYDLTNLLTAEDALANRRMQSPGPDYFLSILPRVRDRLEGRRRPGWNFNGLLARIALPLGASIACILILMNLHSTSSESNSQVKALQQMTEGWTYDEVVDAVASQSMLLPSYGNRGPNEVVESRQLFEDRFVHNALLAQISVGEVGEANMEDVLSSLNKEQVEWILAGYQERGKL
jgi:hypothetical protein